MLDIQRKKGPLKKIENSIKMPSRGPFFTLYGGSTDLLVPLDFPPFEAFNFVVSIFLSVTKCNKKKLKFVFPSTVFTNHLHR